jgi:hypothetical protein
LEVGDGIILAVDPVEITPAEVAGKHTSLWT